MYRDTTENIQSLTGEYQSDKVFSPSSVRNSNLYQSQSQNLSQNQNETYSPFVIKRSPNLLNSNSASKSGFLYTTENQNNTTGVKKINKIYTPSPNGIVKERLSDRFIPMNKGINLLEKFELTKKWSRDKSNSDMDVSLGGNSNYCSSEPTSNVNNLSNGSTYSHLLENNFFTKSHSNLKEPFKKGGEILTPIKSKIFSFRTEHKRRTSGVSKAMSGILSSPSYNVEGDNSEQINPFTRKISNRPYKIVQSPGLMDDFYLNLVDWSSKNDIVVGESNSVFLWCANKTQRVKLLSYEGEKYVSSVIWNQSGTEVAVGNSEGTVEIWDVNQKKLTRVLEGHSARVGVVAWNNQVLSTGSKDYSILNRDLRSDRDYFSKYLSHKQEVCGLKWSFDGTQLASGGNDNKLMVWNLHSNYPLMKSSHHTAAVKAIAWSPNQNNLLISGGGTADRCIRFWNTSTCTQTSYIDTGSQVCNLVFSKTVNELVSTHGYSLNQIIIWKLPSMAKLATLTGHTYRVLFLSISPDGQNIVTGAGDQSLRFWNIFPPLKSNEGSCLFPSHSDLR